MCPEEKERTMSPSFVSFRMAADIMDCLDGKYRLPRPSSSSSSSAAESIKVPTKIHTKTAPLLLPAPSSLRARSSDKIPNEMATLTANMKAGRNMLQHYLLNFADEHCQVAGISKRLGKHSKIPQPSSLNKC